MSYRESWVNGLSTEGLEGFEDLGVSLEIKKATHVYEAVHMPWRDLGKLPAPSTGWPRGCEPSEGEGAGRVVHRRTSPTHTHSPSANAEGLPGSWRPRESLPVMS